MAEENEQKNDSTSTECTLLVEEEKKVAEKRHRALLEFLPIPVFVFDENGSVFFLNSAFQSVFGWTLKELFGKKIPFVPDDLKEKTREDFKRFFREEVVYGYETQRLTKDGKILDIMLDGAVFHDEAGLRTGQIAILRDITKEKRTERTNRALFRIARALHEFHALDDLFRFIAEEVQELLEADGAMVILLDEEKNEFFFRETAFGNSETRERMKEIRFPIHEGVAGQVYRTGKPMVIKDTYDCPYYYYKNVDKKSGYTTRNMLEVPIMTRERTIGVLCAVNKKMGNFDQADVDLAGAIANLVAHPIENARINEELKRSYEEVKTLNRAKERVIHQLAHELKTPVSVLSASMALLKKKLPDSQGSISGILERAERNLKRLLEMQYRIEGILREQDFKTYRMMSSLLDACKDEICALVADETGSEAMTDRIRQRIEEVFAPGKAEPEQIRLDAFTETLLGKIGPKLVHRKCHIIPRIMTTSSVILPGEVLANIIEGLIRNAVENTPDGGIIAVTTGMGKDGPEFEVNDFGVGITEENQKLVFQRNFTTREIMQYSSGNPYDFNAGGKGFDLLRMKIYSEKYGFRIEMKSNRCRHIPKDDDLCPGDIDACPFCEAVEDCINSGGTSMIVRFGSYEAEPWWTEES